MKFLSIAGTAAMFLVGGGILAHSLAPAHHLIENVQQRLQQIEGIGGALSVIAGMAGQAILGIMVGIVVLAAVELVKRFRKADPQAS
jgi:uncharacterized protein